MTSPHLGGHADVLASLVFRFGHVVFGITTANDRLDVEVTRTTAVVLRLQCGSGFVFFAGQAACCAAAAVALLPSAGGKSLKHKNPNLEAL